MTWFNKSATVETIPHVSHLKWDELRLVEVLKEYQAAEKAFEAAHRELFAYARQNPDPRSVFLNGNLFARIAAMTADPQRRELEAARARALAQRNELLQQRAALLKSLGVIR